MRLSVFKLIFLFSIVSTVGLLGIRATNSFLSDTETSVGNNFTVSTVFPLPTPTASPTPTPSPTPSPTPTPGPGSIVINEVYYDVASDKGDDGNSANPDEWIELYNNTNQPVNLKDWTITDNSSSRTISHSNKFIPANGFALLSKSASTWSFWVVPSSAEKIELGQKIGNGLSNEGDRVILKDDQGNIIDQMSYGTDTTVLNPSATDVVEGHSLERDPDGLDSDTAADFVDRTTPTPGT